MALLPATMTAEIYRQDLLAFIHRSFLELNPAQTFESNWHLELIAQSLEDVAYGNCKRLIINVPPRHLKSHSASIAFPAWFLGHFPEKQVACVSYSQDLSDTLARQSRRLMDSAFYQSLFDTRISRKRDTVADFETTQGGFRFSTSVGGGFTGRGGDVIVIDDPLKADEALSDARRESVNEWFDNTLRSRLNRQVEGSIIIIMQRLHADDLVAHVQETEDWRTLSFSAVAEEDESYEIRNPYRTSRLLRKEGDILQPALTPRPVLEALRKAMTPYHFAAQYQQNPQPPAGNIVKREWLKFYAPEEKPDNFGTILQSWDTAVTDTELANFSVCTTWGVTGRKAYLLDVFRRKLLFPDLKRSIEAHAELHDATVVLIEDKSSGSSLIQQLRAEGLSKVRAAPSLDGNKVMRLNGQTPMIEGGFVLFPKWADWLDTYLNELLSFPSSNYDDQVDATVYALAWIGENPIGPSAIIKRPWIHYYTAPPEEPKYKRIVMSWDTALKDGGQSDWTVCTIWQLLEGNYYLLHMERGIYEYSELRKTFTALMQQYRPYQIWFEETATGVALREDRELQSGHLIKLQPIEQDRKGRLYVQQAKFQDARVLFPRDALFMPMVERELLSYPFGDTDDIVDSISLALKFGGTGYDSTLSWV
ncbi:phage terminase large subunit [Pseudorhodoplanes sp.]|uniref:phage terminase large subunit n=1 Tax=Pseudorhodoplanes sp. TaxID=1934341 RepID=UPI003D0B9E37